MSGDPCGFHAGTATQQNTVHMLTLSTIKKKTNYNYSIIDIPRGRYNIPSLKNIFLYKKAYKSSYATPSLSLILLL